MRYPVLAVVALTVVGCSFRACRPAPPAEQAAFECARSAPLALRGVDLCEEAASIARPGTAQLLIDASGSMAGFASARGQRGPLTRIHEWVASAISGLAGDQRTVSLRRVAAFNRVDGMLALPNLRALESLEPRGDTTLDRAVEDAVKEDLTLIVTDGVPFVGHEGAADCAAGADPGCVARRLLDFVRQRTAAGVWLVPIVAAYDGGFFTEGQDVPPDAGAATVIEENVKRSFPRSDVRLALRAGATPPMLYRGPRVVLLLVLANDERLGRAFVRLLLERAPLAQVQSLEGDWSAFDNRERLAGVMTAVEVYPGYLPPARSIEATRVGDASGTIDVRTRGAGESLGIEVGCRAGDEGQTRYRLLFSARGRRGTACRTLHSLASVTLSLCPKDESSAEERQALAAAVRD
ncbi:MAG: hypothetical protein MUF70_17010, partial [Myxococcota bacterium]|nr:hypothetical protein [Myxococcota bacterium]